MKERDKINNIVNNLNDSSNSDIIYALDFLNIDFEQTKDAIVRMTKHLDTVEVVYNKLLKELENRTKTSK
jgi:pimeloyl-CoA synthetase